jgi:hypothetical protein
MLIQERVVNLHDLLCGNVCRQVILHIASGLGDAPAALGGISKGVDNRSR